jgi:hypothetical protein
MRQRGQRKPTADPLAGRPAQAPAEVDQRNARARGAGEVAIARAIAGAVRTVPGVTGLSRGHAALAATYGPAGLVTGVVVYRQCRTPDGGGDEKNKKAGQLPGEMSIEVHVTVDATATLSTPRDASSEVAATKSDNITAPDRTFDEDSFIGFLPAVAAQIRRAAQSAAQNMGLPADVVVDVFIDDLD